MLRYDLSGDFYQDLAASDTLLGKGSTCSSVERCFGVKAGEAFAVKKFGPGRMIADPYTFACETDILQRTTICKVPRVVQHVDNFRYPDGSAAMVMELVEGYSLKKWRAEVAPNLTPEQIEDACKCFAVQLLETLPMMHQDARIAHMYISSGTIVIRSNATAATFDDLRVMDLLFAQQFESDTEGTEGAQLLPAHAAVPQCITWPYASAEQILEMQQYLEGHLPDPINGAASDLWAIGAVLVEMLTGEPPFVPDSNTIFSDAPAHVAAEDKEDWQLYEWLLKQHDGWEDAIWAALAGNLTHPLFDRIRQHSSSPAQAFSFFSCLLWPAAKDRPGCELLHSPYLRSTALAMEKATGRPVFGPDSCSTRAIALCTDEFKSWLQVQDSIDNSSLSSSESSLSSFPALPTIAYVEASDALSTPEETELGSGANSDVQAERRLPHQQFMSQSARQHLQHCSPCQPPVSLAIILHT